MVHKGMSHAFNMLHKGMAHAFNMLHKLMSHAFKTCLVMQWMQWVSGQLPDIVKHCHITTSLSGTLSYGGQKLYRDRDTTPHIFVFIYILTL